MMTRGHSPVHGRISSNYFTGPALRDQTAGSIFATGSSASKKYSSIQEGRSQLTQQPYISELQASACLVAIWTAGALMDSLACCCLVFILCLGAVSLFWKYRMSDVLATGLRLEISLMPTLFAAILLGLFEGLPTADSQAQDCWLTSTRECPLAVASVPINLFSPICCEVNLSVRWLLLTVQLWTTINAQSFVHNHEGRPVHHCLLWHIRRMWGHLLQPNNAPCSLYDFWCGKMPILFDDLKSYCIDQTSLLLLGSVANFCCFVSSYPRQELVLDSRQVFS